MEKMKNKWLCCPKAETTYPSPPTLSFACPPSLLLPPWFMFTNSPSCHSPGLCSLALPLTAPLVCICAHVDSLVCTRSQCIRWSALIHACLCLCTLICTHSWCLGLVFVHAHPCSCGLACLCSCTVWAVCPCSCLFMVFWAVLPLFTLVHVCMD